MLSKDKLRKKFLKIRKLKYFEVTKNYFNPLNKVLNSFSQKKKFTYQFTTRQIMKLTL